MRIVIVIAILFSLTSCAIPLKLVTYTSPEELARQDRNRQEDILRWKSAQKSEELRQEKNLVRENKEKIERNRVLNIFNPEQKKILLCFEKAGISVFDTGKWLNEYGKSDLEGFLDYLSNNNYAFNRIARWALDKGFQGVPGLFSDIRAAYNLYLKMESEK